MYVHVLVCPSYSEEGSQLSLCCGVLMNVCVCEPEVVAQNETFTRMTGVLIRLISKGILVRVRLLKHSLYTSCVDHSILLFNPISFY